MLSQPARLPNIFPHFLHCNLPKSKPKPSNCQPVNQSTSQPFTPSSRAHTGASNNQAECQDGNARAAHRSRKPPRRSYGLQDHRQHPCQPGPGHPSKRRPSPAANADTRTNGSTMRHGHLLSASASMPSALGARIISGRRRRRWWSGKR